MTQDFLNDISQELNKPVSLFLKGWKKLNDLNGIFINYGGNHFIF